MASEAVRPIRRWVVPLTAATRAAIVMPAVFAISEVVIRQPQMALFAAFGSFAILVLVDFSGTTRSRLVAYTGLSCAGLVFLTVGTLCAPEAWLAAVLMAVLGFGVVFAGAINGYFAAAETPAVLAFVLAATNPVPISALPFRLAGWAFAAVAGSCALVLLWPPPPHTTPHGRAAHACLLVADLVDSTGAGNRRACATRVTAARAAVENLRSRSNAAPHRWTGLVGVTAALAALPDELDWLLSFLEEPTRAAADDGRHDDGRHGDLTAKTAKTAAAAAAALRAGAARLQGRDEWPDLDRLDRTRAALTPALVEPIRRLPTAVSERRAILAALRAGFRAAVVSHTARQVACYALAASRAPSRRQGHRGTDRHRVATSVMRPWRAIRRFAVEEGTLRSVTFRNSVRGAVGLGAAVYVARRTGVQHSFWVVLGTLSVLRSTALGTGVSVLRAFIGTVAGIIPGAAILYLVGTNTAVLWGMLAVAVLIGAYAARGVSFAAGQAGFSLFVLVLFSLVQPSGWKVGLVRIEDVAIGFAVSLGVGFLLWPRGAAAVLRQNLAHAYARGADYVLVATRRLVDVGGQTGTDRAESYRVRVEDAAQAAAAACRRLDDSFRQYLAERSPKRPTASGIAVLVAGVGRVRRTGDSLSILAETMAGQRPSGPCGAGLAEEARTLHDWYLELGGTLVRDGTVPPRHTRDPDARQRLLDCLYGAMAGADRTAMRPAIVMVWASQHFDDLWALETHLDEHAEPI